MMNKKTVVPGVFLMIVLSLSGCAHYGGGYGHPDGYGYYGSYYYNDPFTQRYRHDSTRYLYMNDGY